MKNLLLVILNSCFCIGLLAQGATITGNISVLSGSTETYSLAWDNWNTTYENYANVNWNITGGTILNSNKSSVTIQWDVVPGLEDGTGRVEVNEDLGGQIGQLNVLLESNQTSSSDFCNGVLGPPKVFLNFGSGLNPGNALVSGSTSYQYSSGCSLNEGEYTITNNTNLCRTNWHNILSDHTGNINGYFMMVNAQSQRNEIIRTIVNGLTTSFKYQFSAWVGNLYNTGGTQEPYIRFEIYDITGNLIASSGSIVVPVTIPAFQWQQISFMFNLPPNVIDVQVVVLNARTSTSSIGNDLVIDDISFAPCYPGILASFSNTSIIDKAHSCNSGNVSLNSSWAGSIPFNTPSYQWQRYSGTTWADITGATSPSYTQTESIEGIYKYRMLTFETSNPSSSILSNEITYYVQKILVSPITTPAYACNGSSIYTQLPAVFQFLYSDPADNNSYTFTWSPSTHLLNPNSSSAIFSMPGMPTPLSLGPAPAAINYTYNLTIVNNNYGCTSSAVQTVSVFNPRKVGVPNAFTPNGDGINDVWRPVNLEDYPGSELIVYNRWGGESFSYFWAFKS